MKRKIIIVGAGAGGATLAKELAKRGNQITIIEQGRTFEKLGLFPALAFYDTCGLLRSKENTIIYRTLMTGGTTMVSCGNAVRSQLLQNRFLRYGIDINPCYYEAEKEIGVKFLYQTKTSKLITQVAKSIGYDFDFMPKMIKGCKYCGNCELGCEYDAKWTAKRYIDEAVRNGAKLISQRKVIKVTGSGNVVVGVRTSDINGNMKDFKADLVILCAGGLATPRILQRSGIYSVGRKLFCDLFHVTYGIMAQEQKLGHNMPTVCREDGFIVSPFIDPFIQFVLFTSPRHALRYKRIIGFMTKIADQRIGSIMNGRIYKPIHDKDWEKLNAGDMIARKILLRLGARSIITTRVRGAHPGGTAAIGEVIDHSLKVNRFSNLYVCDNSIMPAAPGAPPILTIIALAKWLSKTI